MKLKLSDYHLQVGLLFILISIIFIIPTDAFANSYYNNPSQVIDDGISGVLCKIVTKLTGPIGKTMSMIGLVALGIGIFLGKMHWPLALSTALGITFIFSAHKIINWLTGTPSDGSCTI